MKHLSLLLALAFIGGLLISHQVLAADQYQYKGKDVQVFLADEQLHQSHQEQGYFRDRLKFQDRVHAVQLNRAQVREMQTLLNRRGYIISSQESDNIGRETTAAIQSFQRDQGLAVTGIPNEETLRTLVLNTHQYEFFGLSPEFGEDIE